MTTTEETKPIVPTIRLRGGAIEDKIDDYYDKNGILVETVEEEEQYKEVANTVTTINDKNNNEDHGKEVIGEIIKDKSDDDPIQIPTAPQH